MIKNKKALTFLCSIFVIVEIFLSHYVQITSTDIANPAKFFAIALACAFCVLSIEKSNVYLFTQLALVATVGADYFLVYIPERHQLYGMLCFAVAQILYFLRIYFEDTCQKRKKLNLILRIATLIIAPVCTIAFLGEKADMLAIVSVFYYLNICLNLVFASIQSNINPLLVIGFICFIICDTFIGLANVGPYLQIPEGSFIHTIMNPGFDPSWAFYIPSQTLLAISILPNRFKKQ